MSQIRLVQSSDGPRLQQLQTALAEPSPTLLSAALAEQARAETESAAPSAVRTFTLVVTVNDNNTAVGYLLAIPGEQTHVAELVVATEYRREGRARALLDWLSDATDQPLTVHVAADNNPARALYEEHGFTERTRSADLFKYGVGLTLQYDPQEAGQ